MAKETFSYDSVPYPSYTFPQTHPDRLSTIGSLHGIETAMPNSCRVLELGCGDGTNLLSFAYALPESSFVGVDLSEVHIAKGKAAASELGVSNIELRQEDVTNIGRAELGEFDYIIAHGLFSWVPDPVREHILRIYAECLAPNGVGYISYNAYPGCHLREISSGIMKYEADPVDDAAEKVDAGIEFLESITNAAEKDSLYQMMLKLELSQIEERSDENVYHDDLSAFNQPFYFHQFAAMLGAHGMQFLSEVEPSASNIGKFGGEARTLLANAGGDVLRREQLIDLITCRRFRSTLVCGGGLSIDHKGAGRTIEGYLISSQLEPQGTAGDIKEPSGMKFTGPKGASLEINHPLSKAALVYLHKIYARSSSFDDLLAESCKTLGIEGISDDDQSKCEQFMLQLYDAGFIRLHRYQTEFAAEPGTQPEASRFARWQIENDSESVTTLAGPNLKPENDLTRELIALLDGTRTRADLKKALSAVLSVPEQDKERFEADLPELIEAELLSFARAGVLIA